MRRSVHSSSNSPSRKGPPGFPDTIEDNWSILGTPIGDEAHCCKFLETRGLKTVQDLVKKCLLLQDPQVCFSLLRKCIAFTHGVSISPACLPRLVKSVLAKMDSLVQTAFSTLVGFHPTDSQLKQITL